MSEMMIGRKKWVDGIEFVFSWSTRVGEYRWVATGAQKAGITSTPSNSQAPFPNWDAARDADKAQEKAFAERSPPIVKYFTGAEVVSFHERANEFADEFLKARAAHGPMNSAHEGYAVILEELDEIKQIVWQKQKNRNYADLRKEVVQLGAMALAFLVEIVDTENRK